MIVYYLVICYVMWGQLKEYSRTLLILNSHDIKNQI